MIPSVIVMRADRIRLYRFESPGTAHKKLTFSEFCGDSYEREISHKFIEYLKLCFRTFSHSHIQPPFALSDPHVSLAKESRQLYTLKQNPDAAISITPAIAAPPSEMSATPVAQVNDVSQCVPGACDVEMGDSAPPSPVSQITDDRFGAGEITVGNGNGHSVSAAAVFPSSPAHPTRPPFARIEVAITPSTGTHYLVETSPPVHLFEDEDCRPRWLKTATHDFLRFVPYYGDLAKVVDLFLEQEERLNYPELVRTATDNSTLFTF